MKNIKKIIFSVSIILCLSLLSINVQATKKVKMNPTKKTIYVGKTATVKLNNNKSKVKWSVSNSKIRIVKKSNKSAKIKAVKKGTSYLKAKVGKKTYKCKFTVKNKEKTEEENSEEKTEEINVENIYLNDSFCTLYEKETFNITYSVYPTYATNKNATFTSSNTNVATVDQNGNITAISQGECYITVQCGLVKEMVQVRVLPLAGSRTQPFSAYEEHIVDVYNYGTYLGKFSVKLLDYKDGQTAYDYVMKNEWNTKPTETQEYIYVKFEIKYISGEREVRADDIINHYSGFFNSSSNVQLDNKDWGSGFENVDDMIDVSLYPGGSAICSKAIIVNKGNTPITYRIETGYDDYKYGQIYTWFTTTK